MTPATIGIIVAVAGFTIALLVHIVMIAKAWGSFNTIIGQLSRGAEKLENLVERLFEKTEDHGNRLTSLEVQRQFGRRAADKVEH